MNLKVKLTLVCATLLFCGNVFGQHSDVEFGYEDGGIIFETEGPGIGGAAGVFEAEFEVFNPDGTQVAEDPGFASNFIEGAEQFEVSVGDSVFVNVNQSQAFDTYLPFFNPVTNQFEATDATFTIEDNSPNLTSDLIISQDGLSGDLSQFVITSTGAEIDSHVDYILSADAPIGAYGLLLNIESDNLSGDLTNVTSDTFFVVFNNGLDEEVFEAAVSQFTAVPEPSAFGLVAVLAVAVMRRKRK